MRILSDDEIKKYFGNACDENNLTTISIPIIRKITCHKRVAPFFEAIFLQIEKQGLSHLIKSFDGCYVCRLTRDRPKQSRHSWGIAIDLNAKQFSLNSSREQDTRLRKIFLNYGFLNGQVFTRPDPMHFEFADSRMFEPQEVNALTPQELQEFQKLQTDFSNYKNANDNAHIKMMETVAKMIAESTKPMAAIDENALIEKAKKAIAEDILD